jgi:hypothetical protein
MEIRVQIISVIASLGLIFFIFELIRKRKFLEKYSILWIFSGIVLFVLAIWRSLLEKLAWVLGIEYAPSALFLVFIFLGILMFLHFTMVISRLTTQNKRLGQEIALLKHELEKYKKQS